MAKLITPIAFIETEIENNVLDKIEKYARLAYQSQSKDIETQKKFIKKIMDSGHHSVIEHYNITVKVICDRAIANEWVRHRIGSITQESTRYCNYARADITFIIPCWIEGLTPGIYKKNNLSSQEGSRITIWHDDPWGPSNISLDALRWLQSVLEAEATYTKLIKEFKWSPQQARSILPHCLKTEFFSTMNLRSWLNFFKLRSHSSSHPQMREIVIPLLKSFQEKIPIIFDEVSHE